MLAGALRSLDQREGQLTVEVFEFGRDLSARLLGESMQRHRNHRFGSQGRDAEQRCDRLDGRGPIVGVHDRVEHFMTAVERGGQGIGDLAARGGAVMVGHNAKRRRSPGPMRGMFVPEAYAARPAIGAADGYLSARRLRSMVRVAAVREDANR